MWKKTLRNSVRFSKEYQEVNGKLNILYLLFFLEIRLALRIRGKF